MDTNSLPDPATLLYLGLLVAPGWIFRQLYRRYLGLESESIGYELLATVSLSALLSSVSLLLLAPLRNVPELAFMWLFYAMVLTPVLAAFLYLWYRTGEWPNLGKMLLGSGAQRAGGGTSRGDREGA